MLARPTWLSCGEQQGEAGWTQHAQQDRTCQDLPDRTPFATGCGASSCRASPKGPVSQHCAHPPAPLAFPTPNDGGREQRAADWGDMGMPSEAGSAVSHLQTLVKDLDRPSLPLPSGHCRIQKGLEKPLPTETWLPQRAGDQRKTSALLRRQAVIPEEYQCNGCKTSIFSSGTSIL